MAQGIKQGISPQAYLHALRLLDLPAGHVLTKAEYAQACEIESRQMQDTLW